MFSARNERYEIRIMLRTERPFVNFAYLEFGSNQKVLNAIQSDIKWLYHLTTSKKKAGMLDNLFPGF